MDDMNYNSIEFMEGVALGKSLGANEAYKEVKKALEMGEIELWLEHNEPKTLEEWGALRGKYGRDFKKRWQE